MALERKIYSPWAYTKDEDEKRDINYDIYSELMKKYKMTGPDADIIYSCRKGCTQTTYTLIKKPKELSLDELALICDRGNLCFGYHAENENTITVYTD